MKIGTATLAASALGLVFMTTAFGATWDGDAADGKFTTPKNWNDNKPPTDTKAEYVIANGDTVELAGQTDVGRMTIHGGSVLNIRGGQHSHSQTGKKTRDLYFRDSGGTVNHYGGTLDIGHMLALGSGNAQQGGTYNLTGGKLLVSRGSSTLFRNKAHTLSSVSLEIGDNASQNVALFNITGRAELITRTGVTLGPTGVFSVTGSGVKIGIGSHRNVDGGWAQLPGGTLKFAIDQRGASRVFIAHPDDTPGLTIDFQDGAILELGFAEGTEPYPGEWVVFEAQDTPFDAATVSGLSLDLRSSNKGWSFTFDNRQGNGVLVARYAPVVVAEPE